MNHLSGRRRGRTPLHYPPSPPPDLPRLPPGIFNVQDCYLDYACADSSVRIQIHELLADPHIVSHITTGYIGHEPGPANQVVVAAGQDGPNGALDDVDYFVFGPDDNGSDAQL
jgi:hypothetical protein